MVRFVERVTDDKTLGATAEEVERGIRLADWFTHEARRVYRQFDETDDDHDKRELVEYIRRKGGRVTVRDLERGGPCFKTADEAMAALTALVDAGIGAWVTPKPSPKGGHPMRALKLAPVTDTDRTPTGAIENAGSVSVSRVDSIPTQPDPPPGWTAETWNAACETELPGCPATDLPPATDPTGWSTI